MDQQLKKREMEHLTTAKPIHQVRYWGKITEIPDKVKQANPERYITKMILLFDWAWHKRPTGSYTTIRSICRKLEKVLSKDKVKLVLLRGRGHGGPEV